MSELSRAAQRCGLAKSYVCPCCSERTETADGMMDKCEVCGAEIIDQLRAMRAQRVQP